MKLNALVFISLFILLNSSYASTITSKSSGGNWSSTSTWNGGSVPGTGDDVIINGNVTINNNYTVRKVTINSGKTLAYATGGYTLTLTNTWGTTLINNGTFTAGDGITKFTGSGAEVSGTVVFNNIVLDGGTQMNFGSGSTINGTIALFNAATITTHPTYGANATLEINGSYSLSGNYYLWPNATNSTVPPNIIHKSGTLTLGQMTLFVRKTFTVNSGATVAGSTTCFTLASTFENFYNNGTLTLGGISVSNGATWNMNANYSVNNFTIKNGGIVNLNNYLLTCTYSSNGGLCGSNGDIFKVETGGVFNAGTGTVVLNSTGGGLGISGTINFNNLVVGGGNTVSVTNSNTVVTGNLTVNTGSSINNGGTVLTNNLSFDSTASVTNAGGTTTNLPTGNGVSVTPTPTTILSGTGGGNVAGAAIMNINTTYTLSSNLNINSGTRKILTISPGAELIPGAYTITADTLYLNGTLTVTNAAGLSGVLAGTTKMVIGTGATIAYNSASAQIITPRTDYSHLKLTGAGTKTFAAGNYAIDGDFTVSEGSADITTNNTTFTFNGSNAQNIKGLPYSNVTFGGSGNKTLNGDTKVTGVVTLSGAANLVSNGVLSLVSTASGTASIGPITGTATITGNVNYERYVPAGRLWRFIGWPINGNTFANSWQHQIYITGAGSGGGSLGTTNSNGFDYTASNEAGLYYYNEAAAATINAKWTTVPNTATAIDPARGYRVFIRGARTQGTVLLNGSSYTPLPVTLKGTGTINKGDYPVTLTCSNGCGTGDGWHLLSNPYPSAIDWNNTNWKAARSSNIQATVYVYNPSQNKYGAWSPTGGAVNGGTSNIASGQSFYIKTSGATTLTFKEEYKVSNATVGLFGKSSGLVNNLKVQIGDNTKIYDETVVYMYPSATLGLDQDIDATKPDVANATISSYTSSDNSKLIFNAIPEINNGDSVIVLLHTPLANYTYTYNLSFLGMETFNNPTTQFLLIDNYTGNSTIISTLSPMYSFNTTAGIAASYAGSRFSIKITTVTGSLPVKLTSFSGSKSNKTALLKWTTASEINNDRFEVQSSTNGMDYKTIGTVSGAGHSNKVLHYAFTDEQPAAGINYYRLKQVDKDGASTVSTIISLNFGEAVKTSISAWPIPATDYITLELNNATTTTATLVVRDMMGKAMLTQNILADETNFNYPVPVENFKPGVYIMEVTQNDGRIETIKFVKN